ncbi:LysR family transcriptional regulator [Shewanella schlegeliana]|uniref:LysR family transcriptional regulator n=1 Tax=Shewanella schlegeliana TaxID=190308 RepID=A0ABS1SY24_9GAMM|nr:LysR family transcriptional regulator [Shewanella schlegeliana]MBL4913456.1 LysR family transcriptional regulator [Shewanella schlegeliana]MCL1108347.1 LysR family transcriptional regulator [Shewanella schlegeliana]GIU37382.1 LysR family transcriptional regulator [Shewanella schlegeliana]
MSQQKSFDLNLFRIFTAVYRTSSFSRAAEELDLTQSSVSNAIARLKFSVGEELFIRVGRGVKPTASAMNLYQQLAIPVSEIELVASSFELFDASISERTFYVYASESAIQLLQGLVEQALEELSINIVFREPPLIEEELQMELQLEKVDLALDIWLPESSSFKSQKVMQDKLVCVARKDHPRITGAITQEQYFSEKHIIFKMRRYNLSVADLLTKHVLPARQMHSEQSSILSMMAVASKSDALAIASKSYTDEYAELFGLQVFDLPFDVEPIEYYMVWSHKLEQNPANIWLRNTILKLIK